MDSDSGFQRCSQLRISDVSVQGASCQPVACTNSFLSSDPFAAVYTAPRIPRTNLSTLSRRIATSIYEVENACADGRASDVEPVAVGFVEMLEQLLQTVQSMPMHIESSQRHATAANSMRLMMEIFLRSTRNIADASEEERQDLLTTALSYMELAMVSAKDMVDGVLQNDKPLPSIPNISYASSDDHSSGSDQNSPRSSMENEPTPPTSPEASALSLPSSTHSPFQKPSVLDRAKGRANELSFLHSKSSYQSLPDKRRRATSEYSRKTQRDDASPPLDKRSQNSAASLRTGLTRALVTFSSKNPDMIPPRGIGSTATPMAIIEFLTSTDCDNDPSFLDAFLFGLGIFRPRINLAGLLFTRYEELTSPDAISPTWTRAGLWRMAKILEAWFEHYWLPSVDGPFLPIIYELLLRLREDKEGDVPLLKKIHHLYSRATSTGLVDPRRRLMMRSGITSHHHVPIRSMNESSHNAASRSKDIMEYDTTSGRMELARQLTVFASEIYRAVLPEEVLRLQWGFQDDEAKAQIDKFSRTQAAMCYWAQNRILLGQTSYERAKIIGFFLEVAKVSG